MTDSEFLNQAEALLQAVEACCDRINDHTDADVDNQRVGGMVTLTFPNRSQIVIPYAQRQCPIAVTAGFYSVVSL